MKGRKFFTIIFSLFILASLMMQSGIQATAAPASAVDETKVPHYYGPYPNWANSPYTMPDVQVVITGNGSGAEAVATVGANGAILDVTVTSPGHNYSNAKVDFISTNGSGAQADVAIVKKGAVVAITLDAAGSGYTAPTVSFSGNGGAAATAYGGVDVIQFTNGGGSGYSFPTVDFDMPDGPNGVQAQAHAVLGANGSIEQVVLDDPGSGYSTAPKAVIRDGTIFDPINHDPGTFEAATISATLSIQGIVLDAFGGGYNQVPTVTINDPTGSGATATAELDNGIISAITMKKPGSGYLTSGGIQKFIDPLPGLCTPPACPATGKYIPLAVPEVKTYNGIEADEYVIGLVQYQTSFNSSLPLTMVRGYIQLETAANVAISQHFPVTNTLLDGTQVPVLKSDGTQWLAVTPPQYMGPTIAATKDRPVRIVFYNLLPTGVAGDLFLPTDSTLMGSGLGPNDTDMAMDQGSVLDTVRNPVCSEYPKSDLCYADNRATLHLHGGISPWISDGTPHQWITPANETTPYPQGVSVGNVPDMDICQAADDGCMTFYYTNQQSARLMFYHDHAWGITRLNVYAGEAAGYLITDATEQALINSGTIPGAADTIPLLIQDKTFVPSPEQLAAQDPTWDTAHWGGMGNFWYHHVYMPAQNPGDPGGMSAYGRWMYGPWFWPPATNTLHGPIANPYYNMDPKGPDGIIGTTDDWTSTLAVPCNLDDPATWQYQTDPFCEPEQIPGTPNISVGMEQFNDTPVVNGVAYPTLTLEPRAYRFRILSVANDRFFNLQWYVGDTATASTNVNTLGQVIGPTEVALNPAELAAAQLDPNVFPTPVQGTPGPDWIQIGTEGGFLPAPVVVDGQQPTTWITDPTRFDVGNVDQHSLLLAPAERADVIVDFSRFAGQTLILYNDAPAAFPARVSSYDYYTGAPDLSPVGAPTILPGYGPNTRTVMQIKIAASNPAPTYNLANLQAAFRHNANGTGVFESGQHPIIVGQAAYNTAYGTSFASGSNCNAPGSSVQRCDGFVRVNDTTVFGFNTLLGQNTKMTIPLQPKAIHDEMNASSFDEFGRMTANLGLEAQPPAPGAQNVTLYPYVNPPTELIDATNLPKNDVIYDANGQPVSDIKITPISDAADGTQIWRITHNGVDTHPIHFHLYDVQLVNRVTWDNIIIPPDANELGWKDTVRIAPLEDTIVALRPIIPELPWELPNAIRPLSPMLPVGVESMMFNSVDPQGVPTVNILNDLVNFGWEYVFHCHILSHEEMDMMRPVSVAMPPVVPDGLAFDLATATLTWNDNSIAETAYVVQKSVDGGVTWVDLVIIPSPLADPNTTGVRTFPDASFDPNVVSLYRVVAQNTVGYGLEFPSMTVQSMSAELAVDAMIPPQAPTGLSAAYQAGSGVVLAWTDNATNETGFGVERSDDGGVTFNQIATLGVDVTSYTDATVAFEMTYIYRVFAFNAFGSSAPSNDAPVTTPLATPTNLVAAYLVGPNVSLTWLDNSFAETGYTVERSVNGGPFALLMSLGIDSTSYTDTSVVDNNAYAYRVYAFDGVGSSAFSNEAAIATLPAAPTNLGAVYQAGTGVVLTWTDNAAVETGYRVERSTDGVTFSLLVELGANVVASTDAPVAFETTYTYRVYAFNGSGDSTFFSEAAVTTPLATPTNLLASYVAGTGISLTWLDNSFAETGYVVERSVNGGGFTQLVSLLGVDITSYTDTSVAFDATYVYRVYAAGSPVNSGFSNEAAVVTPPNAPTNLTATTGRQGNRAWFNLSWTDSSVTETGFTIQYSIDSTFLTNVITVNLAANATSFTTGNILPRNTTYFIRIQAVNGTGSSAWVSVSITTP